MPLVIHAHFVVVHYKREVFGATLLTPTCLARPDCKRKLGRMNQNQKYAEALDHMLTVRVTRDEKSRLRADAEVAGLTVSELVRRRYFGRPIVSKADLVAINELRRQGGLLKMIHNQTNGMYAQEVIHAIVTIREAIEKLASRE